VHRDGGHASLKQRQGNGRGPRQQEGLRQTGGGGERGYSQVALSILWSEPAAQIETGRLHIAPSDMGRALIAGFSAVEVNDTPMQTLGPITLATPAPMRVRPCFHAFPDGQERTSAYLVDDVRIRVTNRK
jgi:hypothetical protein